MKVQKDLYGAFRSSGGNRPAAKIVEVGGEATIDLGGLFCQLSILVYIYTI